jgi:predicted GTPase
MTTNKDKFNGGIVVRDAMSWLIKQGDAILPDQPIRKHLKVLIKFTKPQVDQGSNFRIAFAATKTVNPPSNFAQLSDGRLSFFFF